jgi:hypothetical protein
MSASVFAILFLPFKVSANCRVERGDCDDARSVFGVLDQRFELAAGLGFCLAHGRAFA